MHAPPAGLLDDLGDELGEALSCTPIPSATQARVWRVELRTEVVALKVWATGGGRRERRVLTLLERNGVDAPRVRWWQDGPLPALACSWVEGTRPADDRKVHHAAGTYLRRLHEVPVDDDPMGWADAMAQRRDTWIRRAQNLVPSELGLALAHLLDDRVIEDMARVVGPRVLCHRDFERRNWLEERDTGRLRVIDFGQARPDAWLWDLVKLAEGPWQRFRDAQSTFFAGYGTHLQDGEVVALRQLGALHGFQTLVWGLEHAQPEFERLGREIVARRLE